MKYIVICILAFMVSYSSFSQSIPEGYLLQYQQNFSTGKALNDFKVNNPKKWGIFKETNNFYLQCDKADSGSFTPTNMAVLNNKIFGDFIMEVDIMPVPDSSGAREACLFLGIRDSSRYYYTQLSDRKDSSNHGVFLVKNFMKSRLTDDSINSVSWSSDRWYKVRLVRNIVRRTIVIYFEDMTHPFMLIKDYELVMGSLGLGSFSGSARFDNIKIWAPTVLNKEQAAGANN